MTLFFECLLIAFCTIYFFTGLIFAIDFSIEMGNRGFKHFKRFVNHKAWKVFVLIFFAPWLAVSIITVMLANIVFFFMGKEFS